MHDCQVKAETSGWPHEGEVGVHEIRLDVQPPGYGSFTLTTQAHICEGHRKWFKDGRVNLSIR